MPSGIYTIKENGRHRVLTAFEMRWLDNVVLTYNAPKTFSLEPEGGIGEARSRGSYTMPERPPAPLTRPPLVQPHPAFAPRTL